MGVISKQKKMSAEIQRSLLLICSFIPVLFVLFCSPIVALLIFQAIQVYTFLLSYCIAFSAPFVWITNIQHLLQTFLYVPLDTLNELIF